jgi:hypothetical protein
MKEAETRAKRWARAGGFNVRRVVEEAIRDQKEHRDHCSDRIEASGEDGCQRDHAGQQNGATRIPPFAVAYREDRKPGKDAIDGQRLEDPRCAKKGRKRRRQSCRQQASVREPSDGRCASHRRIVASELGRGESCPQEDDQDQVDTRRDPDREKRAKRNATRWILEVTRHVHTLGEPGDCRKENGEQNPEAKRRIGNAPVL